MCVFAGLIDAGCKIYHTEGLSGLYRGFWVNSIQMVSGFSYIGTYEGVRHISSQYNINPHFKTILAASAASIVGQTIIVPFDVISQHLMLLGLIDRSASPEKKVSKIQRVTHRVTESMLYRHTMHKRKGKMEAVVQKL